MTFAKKMTVYLGSRRVDLMHLGRAHTAGDIVAWVPDEGVMLTGDIVEYHSIKFVFLKTVSHILFFICFIPYNK